MQPDNSFIKKPLKKKPRIKQTDWKLPIYLIFVCALIMIFNFYQPARELLLEFGEQIETLDWIGPLLFIGFLGIIIIPFGLPYLIFECAVALLYNSFIIPFIIAMVSKFIGCSLSFYLGRYGLRRRFESWIEKDKSYQSLRKMINDSPWKFSCIFRLIFLPFLVKNYGLAMVSSMNYFIYISTALMAGAILSTLNITFAQKTRLISEGFFEDTDIDWYNIIIFILTLFFLGYIVYYTKKMIMLLNEEEGTEKTSGLSIELDATVGDDAVVLDQVPNDNNRKMSQ